MAGAHYCAYVVEQADWSDIELDRPAAEASRRHAELTELLNNARWRYYVLDAPTISDGEFDARMRELSELEDAYLALRTPCLLYTSPSPRDRS